jgi:tetratricopeptide (TPR) repeat protein
MAPDRQKQLQLAERLLKQGKVQAAMLELERLADSAPSDVLTLNRIGDLLAKQGRKDEAIRFYTKIARQFTKSGFLPKAVAIHKKILRLNTNFVASLVELGELYFQQKLPGEARSYLLRAADQYLHARNFTKAREVYERLVAAEPDDPRHRARLAEARAAEGETSSAGEELLALANSLFASGKPTEAEQSYRRAAELLPDSDEPIVGLVRSLGEQGRDQEALDLLDKAEKEHGGSPALLGERVLRFELAGKPRDAVELLKLPAATRIEDDIFLRIFRHHRDRDALDPLWERLDPVFDRWREGGEADRLRALFIQLIEIEEGGHVQALKRVLAIHELREDSDAARETLEQLVRACRTQSRVEEIDELLQQLRRVAPDSPLLGEGEPEVSEAVSQPRQAPSETPEPVSDRTPDPMQQVVDAAPAAPAPGAARSGGEPPIEAEAPAVPLNRGDEEYVNGRLTQTEILEKYGLRDQAVQQVREVTQKFPGHVAAQEKLVELLREGDAPDDLRDALVSLALARRAEGDAAGARKSCGEASLVAPLSETTTRMLAQLGLVEADTPEMPPRAEPVATTPAEPEPPVEATKPPAPSPPAEVTAAPVETTLPSRGDGAVLIDFDAMDLDTEAEDVEETPEFIAEPASAAPSAPPAELEPPSTPTAPEPAVEVVAESEPDEPVSEEVVVDTDMPITDSRPAPAEEVLEEIRDLIVRGEINDARRRMEALETLGWVTEKLVPLKEEITALLAQAEPASETPPSDAEPIFDPVDDLADDDDLTAITAALESELFADEVEPIASEPESEQSLEEVFAAFKDHVDREVSSDDYRTHYDLGIAYKEMGLLDEAIDQFGQAVKSPELGRESYTMLALCHRERDEMDAAASCYREAIESTTADGDAANSLRYELAEVLLISGDRDGALDQFRHLMQADPSFRDVRNRVAELESRVS